MFPHNQGNKSSSSSSSSSLSYQSAVSWEHTSCLNGGWSYVCRFWLLALPQMHWHCSCSPGSTLMGTMQHPWLISDHQIVGSAYHQIKQEIDLALASWHLWHCTTLQIHMLRWSSLGAPWLPTGVAKWSVMLCHCYILRNGHQHTAMAVLHAPLANRAPLNYITSVMQCFMFTLGVQYLANLISHLVLLIASQVLQPGGTLLSSYLSCNTTWWERQSLD